MFIYQIVIFFVIVCFLSVYNVIFAKEKFNKLLLFFLLFILTLIAGFRDSTVDSDFLSYTMIFDSSPLLNDFFEFDLNNSTIEIGYLFLNSFIKYLFNDYRVIFILMALLPLIVYAYIFNKETPYVIVSLLVLISTNYLFEMAQLRQGIVCALMLLSTYYIREKKIYKFLIIVGIGCCFHYTMLLSFIFYAVTFINWTKKKIIMIILFCLLILQINWIENFLTLLPSDWNLAFRLLHYTNNPDETIEGARGLGDLKLIFLLVVFGIAKPYVEKYTKYYNILLSMFIIAIILRFSFHEYIVFSSRLSEPFFPSQCLLIPMLLHLPINKYIILTGIIIFCIISFTKGLNAPFLYILN